MLSLPFLIEGDAHDHEHEEEQKQSFFQITEQKIEHARGDQQQEHRFAHHIERDRQEAT